MKASQAIQGVLAAGLIGGLAACGQPAPQSSASSNSGARAAPGAVRSCSTAGNSGLPRDYRQTGQRYGPLTLMLGKTQQAPVGDGRGRFGTYEAIVVVDAGNSASIQIPSDERESVGLVYDLHKFRDDGAYRVSQLDQRVTFNACARRSFNHGVSQFDGGFVVDRPRCVRYTVTGPYGQRSPGQFAAGRACTTSPAAR